MALIFTDPNPAGPFTSFQVKDLQAKVFRLTNVNFGTSAVNTLIGRLSAPASIMGMALWVKTQLAGGGITAASISVGSSSGGTQYVNGFSAFGTAGALSIVTPITNIFQAWNPPYTTDLDIWISGTATTGNPTSGELYLRVDYVN